LITRQRPVDARVRPNFVFIFFFGAGKQHFLNFSAFYFSAEKDIRIFVSFLFLGTKMAVKTKKKKASRPTLAEAMHGGQNSESPAVAAAVYIATRTPAVHDKAVSTEQSQQTQSAVSAAAVDLR